jgi:hypothetical protein
MTSVRNHTPDERKLQTRATTNPSRSKTGLPLKFQKLTPEEKERRRTSGLCLYCGEGGHFASTCPYRRMNEDPHRSPTKPTPSSTDRNSHRITLKEKEHPRAPRLCHYCGSPAHVEQTCPNKTVDHVTRPTTEETQKHPRTPSWKREPRKSVSAVTSAPRTEVPPLSRDRVASSRNSFRHERRVQRERGRRRSRSPSLGDTAPTSRRDRDRLERSTERRDQARRSEQFMERDTFRGEVEDRRQGRDRSREKRNRPTKENVTRRWNGDSRRDYRVMGTEHRRERSRERDSRSHDRAAGRDDETKWGWGRDSRDGEDRRQDSQRRGRTDRTYGREHRLIREDDGERERRVSRSDEHHDWWNLSTDHPKSRWYTGYWYACPGTNHTMGHGTAVDSGL